MKRYKFSATIQPGDGGGAFVFFPFDVQKEFGAKGRVLVKATFDGAPYSGSLFKYSSPQHMLGVLKSIRGQIGKDVGDTVDVEVWKDEKERTLEIPAGFEQLLKKERLLSIFENLSYTHRKEYCRWITEAKKQETRARRLEKAVAMLKQGTRTPG